jgi:hypothetical protein
MVLRQAKEAAMVLSSTCTGQPHVLMSLPGDRLPATEMTPTADGTLHGAHS